jgi:hypothetical protein
MNKERIIAVEGRVLRIPVSNSTLDSLERRENRESKEILPEKYIVNYYSQQLKKVNPDWKKNLADTVKMYKDNL